MQSCEGFCGRKRNRPRAGLVRSVLQANFSNSGTHVGQVAPSLRYLPYAKLETMPLPNGRPEINFQEAANGPMTRLRALIHHRLERLPTTLLNLGAYITIMGKMLQIVVDHEEVTRRTQRRMRAEDLVKGRDNERAHTIAAEELTRYRAEFQDDVAKFEVSTFEKIDPWRGFDDGSTR